jgi:hypothetical protein
MGLERLWRWFGVYRLCRRRGANSTPRGRCPLYRSVEKYKILGRRFHPDVEESLKGTQGVLRTLSDSPFNFSRSRHRVMTNTTVCHIDFGDERANGSGRSRPEECSPLKGRFARGERGHSIAVHFVLDR